ncbi:cation:proton antiporter [Luteolibacter marinus]|uniref:cation:proton antiporter n=1 Tax=Luteolibacter marinus TaxID=2776705 RepID=UPI001866A002|nr:cation:proton antiporter [Luteolibacter marinus]
MSWINSLLIAAGDSGVTPFFGMLAMVLVLAVFVSLALVKLRQSLLVGYFLCGVLIANSGFLGLVGIGPDDPMIGNLGELGVILLMFTLGLEFSIDELRHLWRTSLIGGGVQVGVTAAIAAVGSRLFGIPWPETIVLSVAIALSSTAVAMKSFQEIGQPNNPGARVALGVALFQDILVILFILILPAIYGENSGSTLGQIAWALCKGMFFLGSAVLLGRYGNTALLHAVARTRSRELFTLTIIGTCAAVALAGEALDLGLSLGAFAAGLVLSESIYSHRILADILPFKDLFLTIFFVSVGLMIDVGALLDEWLFVVVGSLAILMVKGAVVFGVTRILKLPLKPALLAAASLSSTGEFSLVLLKKAGGFQPFDPAVEQLLLACTAVTMGLVPSLMRGAGPLGRWLESKGVMVTKPRPPSELAPLKAIREISDHAIICGYGPVGRALNEALRRCDIPTLVLELNADTVRELKAAGQPVLFADAGHPEALDLAGIERARFVAFTFPAVGITLAALPQVREKNPGILVFARAKFQSEVNLLRSRDVQVIHDERESAIAMIESAMGVYQRADLSHDDFLAIVDGK